MRRLRFPSTFTLSERAKVWLVRLAKRAGHDNMSRELERLIEKEYERQARKREREGAA